MALNSEITARRFARVYALGLVKLTARLSGGESADYSVVAFATWASNHSTYLKTKAAAFLPGVQIEQASFDDINITSFDAKIGPCGCTVEFSG